MDDLYQDAERLAVQFDRLERAVGGVPGMDIEPSSRRRRPGDYWDGYRTGDGELLALRDYFKATKIAGMVYDAPRLLTCDDSVGAHRAHEPVHHADF